MYSRLLADILTKRTKSALILGPRQVGKSTLMQQVKLDLSINLADEDEFFLFQSQPRELERRIRGAGAKRIFIDEIQRVPRLMNNIQVLIDQDSSLRFFLTGSSARKLRRGNANLLPGRLLMYQLAPLAIRELGADWNERAAMSYGSLPGLVNLSNIRDKKELLRSYASLYLKEEIMAEALVRQVGGFVRFLSVAAGQAGLYLDYSKLAQKAKIPRQTAVRHFEILEDTLIVQKVECDNSLEADLIKHPRFFFFDLGVLNALLGTFEVSQDRLGWLYEHLVFNQIYNSCVGQNLDFKVFNFRTRGGFEVDFILQLEGKTFAIECKASDTVSESEVLRLKSIKRYYAKCSPLIIYRGERELKEQGVWILPLKKALASLGL